MTDVVEDVLDAPGGSTEVSILDPIQRIQAGLIELKAQAGPFDISTTAGMKAARQFRALCVKARTALDAAYEKVNRPLLDTQRAARDLKKAITEEILQLETPVDEAITADEQRRERERAERQAAEEQRIAAIQRRMAAFSSYSVRAMGEPSGVIEDLIRELVAREPDATFEEFRARAAEAHAAALQSLRDLLPKVLAQEAEAARLAEERARLEAERRADEERRAEQARQEAEERAQRDREEQAERDRIAAEREAERQAEVARQQAEREAQAARMREERERQQAELAEQRRQQEAEAAAERMRLAEERAALERQRQEQEAAEQRRREEEEARARAEREAAEARERESEAERQRLAEAEQVRLSRLHGAAQSLLTLARNLRLTLAHNGEWDDGCFYYHRTAAPELGVLDQHAEAAIAQAELPATED